VAVSRGRIYVCDYGNDRVSVFDESDGSFVRWFGGPGPDDDQFCGCGSIATCSLTGNVFVGDASGRVQVFNADGEFLRILLSRFNGCDPRMLASVGGNVYVSDRLKGCVLVFGLSGALQHSISLDKELRPIHISGMTISNDGRLFAVDRHFIRVFE